MMLRMLVIVMAVLSIMTVSGCKKQTPPKEPTEVKITTENLDSELDKMEAEIDAEAAAEK